MRVTHMHGLQCECRHLSVISPSPLSCFTRPCLLFPDGHFETTPDCDLTDFDVHDFLPNFPDLKAQVKRTPHEDELFGYLAKSALNTGYEPKSSTRSLPWMMTRCSSTIRTTIYPTSPAPRTRTLVNSVLVQCLNPLFCTFLIGDLVPQRESKESTQSGNRC